nr:MAG: hypothetical protein [Microviridae sp.]
MDAKKSRTPLQTDLNDQNHLTWYGLQFIMRLKTGEITQRSFPFWAPTLKWAIDYARETNKQPRENKTYWTHVLTHTKLIETPTGSIEAPVDTKEVRI